MPFYNIPVPRPPSLGIGGVYFDTISVRRCLDIHLETAKAVFADEFTGVGVEEIDQHEFFWMAGEVIGVLVDELLLALRIGTAKSLAQVQTMGTACRIEPQPIL